MRCEFFESCSCASGSEGTHCWAAGKLRVHLCDVRCWQQGTCARLRCLPPVLFPAGETTCCSPEQRAAMSVCVRSQGGLTLQELWRMTQSTREVLLAVMGRDWVGLPRECIWQPESGHSAPSLLFLLASTASVRWTHAHIRCVFWCPVPIPPGRACCTEHLWLRSRSLVLSRRRRGARGAQVWDPVGWTAMKLEWGALWWVAHDENVRAPTGHCVARCSTG